MKILVIGGNRFFGKKLVNRLLFDGHQVTVLNRQNLDDGFGDQVNRIKCDRTDSKSLGALTANTSWDLIFDQVCYQASEAKDACEIFNGRVGKYIFTSSQSVYEPGEWLPEDAFNPHQFTFTKEANAKLEYAEAKRQCEAVFFGQAEFAVAAIRFTFVVGDDDYTNRFKWHVDRIRAGESIYFPNPGCKISMIHSDDAADVLASFTRSSLVGPVNACAPEPIELAELVAYIETVTNKKAVLASSATSENSSPYGIEQNWFMSIEKLQQSGIYPKKISDWVKPLISHFQSL